MMNTEADDKTRNKLQAVGGKSLMWARLSMAVAAGTIKAKGGKWFGYGTLALIVFQAGLCLVVGSTRYNKQR